MKKLRITVEGKAYDVLVELLDETPNGFPGPSPQMESRHVAAPVAAPPPAPVAAAPAAPASAPAPAAAPADGANGAGNVPSPLAGKVVGIDVKVGDVVKEGAQVATLEAMKMNTYIYAPKAGRVEQVFVNPGDAVNEGTPLLRVG